MLALILLAITSSVQSPASGLQPARFHHVHLNSTDPAEAMQYFARHFGAVKVILPGLSVGVRLERSYLLFDSVDEPAPAEARSAAWHIGWSRSQNFLAGPDGLLLEVDEAPRPGRLDHVHLYSADPKAAAQWYEKHLGVGPGAGEVQLVFSPRPAGLEKLLPSRGRLVDHLAFSYADLGAALRRLEAEGVRIIERQAQRAFVEGPDNLLVEVVEDAGPDAAVYWCPMDPEVRAGAPGKCPVCQMTLVPLRPGDFAEYAVELQAVPPALRPGQPGRLRFAVHHPDTRQRVRDFEVVHEKPFHLFVVSHDLDYFAHIHPTQEPDGAFSIETAFPRPGHYQLYADFFPTGGTPQVIQKSFTTAGYAGRLATPGLAPDSALEKSDQGIRVSLKADSLISGKKQLLSCYLTEEETGAPVGDLELYLGAAGHMLILSADLADYVHSHPAAEGPSGKGPEVVFEALFPRPGIYRIWAQFQRRGRVHTVSFTVPVSRLG